MKRKIKTILKNGISDTLDAYEEGVYNFNNPTKEIEDLARQRLKECDCLEREPISFLRVKDERIPKLSEMICGECGCTASYKFRQSKDKCKQWSS